MLSTCQTCGGLLYRQQIARDYPTGPWLHASDQDWKHRPHTAVAEDMEATR